MAEYLITCVRKSERTATGHKHIVRVGVGIQQYTVAQIYQAISRGDAFKTASPTSGQLAIVAEYSCCGIHTLRSHADNQWNDNLDSLPKCL